MRVTANSYSTTLLKELRLLAERQGNLQTQAATGQRIRNLQDDPKAVARVLTLQHEGQAVAQYRKNIDQESSRANATYSVIQGLKKVSDRAGEIARLAEGPRPQQDLDAYANELDQLLRHAVNLANTQHNNTYLFAGTKNTQPAFEIVEASNGSIATVTYRGNQELAEIEISEGVTTTAQVLGANTGTPGSRGLFADAASGANMFQHLIELRDHLRAGDLAAIAGTDRQNLAADEDNILFHVSHNGAIQARLTATAGTLGDRSQAVTGQISGLANADLAETMVLLNTTVAAYEAALQGTARILSLSLQDFLR